MLWLYVPPVILVAALITLVVVLGRKSAELKKSGGLQKEDRRKDFSGVDERSKLKNFGQGSLRVFEKLLIWLKLVVKMSEQSIAKLVSRIRARRTDAHSYRPAGEPMQDLLENQEDGAGTGKHSDIAEKVSRSDETDFIAGETEWISSEVVVRKKRVEEPVARIKEEPAAEDKVKEDALIHRIAENPKDMEAYRDLGDYYMSVGNIRDAKDSFKMVLRLRPRDLKAKSSLREIEMKMRLGN